MDDLAYVNHGATFEDAHHRRMHELMKRPVTPSAFDTQLPVRPQQRTRNWWGLAAGALALSVVAVVVALVIIFIRLKSGEADNHSLLGAAPITQMSTTVTTTVESTAASASTVSITSISTKTTVSTQSTTTTDKQSTTTIKSLSAPTPVPTVTTALTSVATQTLSSTSFMTVSEETMPEPETLTTTASKTSTSIQSVTSVRTLTHSDRERRTLQTSTVTETTIETTHKRKTRTSTSYTRTSHAYHTTATSITTTTMTGYIVESKQKRDKDTTDTTDWNPVRDKSETRSSDPFELDASRTSSAMAYRRRVSTDWTTTTTTTSSTTELVTVATVTESAIRSTTEDIMGTITVTTTRAMSASAPQDSDPPSIPPARPSQPPVEVSCIKRSSKQVCALVDKDHGHETTEEMSCDEYCDAVYQYACDFCWVGYWTNWRYGLVGPGNGPREQGCCERCHCDDCFEVIKGFEFKEPRPATLGGNCPIEEARTTKGGG
jgi:hypothetical protein